MPGGVAEGEAGGVSGGVAEGKQDSSSDDENIEICDEPPDDNDIPKMREHYLSRWYCPCEPARTHPLTTHADMLTALFVCARAGTRPGAATIPPRQRPPPSPPRRCPLCVLCMLESVLGWGYGELGRWGVRVQNDVRAAELCPPRLH